jgi:hypothetical protein
VIWVEGGGFEYWVWGVNLRDAGMGVGIAR